MDTSLNFLVGHNCTKPFVPFVQAKAQVATVCQRLCPCWIQKASAHLLLQSLWAPMLEEKTIRLTTHCYLWLTNAGAPPKRSQCNTQHQHLSFPILENASQARLVVNIFCHPSDIRCNHQHSCLQCFMDDQGAILQPYRRYHNGIDLVEDLGHSENVMTPTQTQSVKKKKQKKEGVNHRPGFVRVI